MPEGHEDRPVARRPDRRPAGELEASVLAALRAADGPLTPIAVRLALGTDLARTTVTTILTRLRAKGAVTRTHAGRGYVYTPAQDPPGLTARRMHAELDKDADRDTALARFAGDLGPQDRQLLRTLLDEGPDGGEPRDGVMPRT
ncbi:MULTISPECIES: BlaI/MecI/CopY family transcriptional regulator [unclassified Streptomyces]|uniref:BlaI/MecI/CopY family transcriptional regulator n=1 Tax=unclassified Streptomyces TaxID=2593676 RepID=UPI000370CFF1|nr:BlaI/MecI/CopY family transcriptional regulator [Streptomyces sp. 303MFCol5.2]